MSHDLSPVSLKDVPAIVRAAPIRLTSVVKFGLIVLIVIGVLGFLLQLFGGDSKSAWMSLHVNFTFWFCVAAASSCFAAVFQICNAQWSRPIRRIFESAIPFLLCSPLFLFILYFGHGHLFEWAHAPAHGKEFWLSSGFLFTRDIVGIVLLGYVAKKVIFNSLRRDLLAIRGGLTGLSKDDLSRWQDKKYDRYVASSSSDAVSDIQETTSTMGRLSPVVIMVYALVMTLIAFDQIMSVDQHWYSTMFGGFYFMSGVYMAVAFAAMGFAMLRNVSPLFRAKVERRTLHDLGKLLFGFGIFWAYLFWSHYLPIWYANLPEETGWLIARLRVEPWQDVAWIVLGASWVIPFWLGLSRDLKQVPILLCITAIIATFGIWLQQYLLFAPTLYPDTLPFSLVDLAIGLGFLGGYVLSAVSFLEKAPLMPFGDLYK
jgi:hypothetical protein